MSFYRCIQLGREVKGTTQLSPCWLPCPANFVSAVFANLQLEVFSVKCKGCGFEAESTSSVILSGLFC